ncbi:MAG TPA: class I SAM-dependent methyltransferase [Gaiellaceae bacterium]|nr:class I SAM-dependent methyltransferase [Gaiellaceae bacterium]
MRPEDWDRKYAARELLWGAEPNRVLVAEVGALPPGRALDLACGEGRNAVWLALRAWEVVGVDFSPVALGRARERARREGVHAIFEQADLLDYVPERGRYDLVLVLFLQLPADERRIVLERAAAALAPGGTLLLLGHDLANLTQGVGGPSDPAVLYTPEQIVAELPGLEVVKAERVLRTVAGEERPAIDALVRARRPAPARATGGSARAPTGRRAGAGGSPAR